MTIREKSGSLNGMPVIILRVSVAEMSAQRRKTGGQLWRLLNGADTSSTIGIVFLGARFMVAFPLI